MPEMPGVPEMPFGSQAPAMEAGPKPGQGVTGEVIVSMAISALEMAIPMMPDNEDKIAATQAHLTLIKRFGEVKQDLQESQLKFWMSQMQPAQRPNPMESGPGIRNSLAGLGVNPPQVVENPAQAA